MEVSETGGAGGETGEEGVSGEGTLEGETGGECVSGEGKSDEGMRGRQKKEVESVEEEVGCVEG